MFKEDTIDQQLILLVAQFGQVDKVNLRLDQNVFAFQARTSFDKLTIHLAAFAGHKNEVNLILNWGTGIDARANHQQQTLHRAVKCGNIDVVTLLLNDATNIYAKNVQGYQPVHVAAIQGHTDVLNLRINRRAD